MHDRAGAAEGPPPAPPARPASAERAAAICPIRPAGARPARAHGRGRRVRTRGYDSRRMAWGSDPCRLQVADESLEDRAGVMLLDGIGAAVAAEGGALFRLRGEAVDCGGQGGRVARADAYEGLRPFLQFPQDRKSTRL